jgi:hypothetical protein
VEACASAELARELICLPPNIEEVPVLARPAVFTPQGTFNILKV